MLLPMMVFLTCGQANTLIARVVANNLPPQNEAALIREIKLVSPKKCDWRM
jgi:hypothetical protein